MKRFISIFLAVIFVSMAGCSAITPTDTVVSASSSASEQFLIDRLGSADGFVLGTEKDAVTYGIDMTNFQREGYIIRSDGENTLIFGKTEDGLDRGVRYYVNHCEKEGPLNVVYDEGYRVKAITIAGRDISEYSIYLFEGADKCHTTAANELKKYIKLACGIELPIVREPVEHMIVLEQVLEDDPRAEVLGTEGFNISVKDNGDLWISGGRDRGCLYGVYELLEAYIGWRFVANTQVEKLNDNTFYLYESDLVDIPAGLVDEQTPSFEYRHSVSGTSVYKKTNYAIRGSAAYNGWGISKYSSHGLYGFLASPFAKEAISSPEMLSGAVQPCFTDEYTIEAAVLYYNDLVEKQISAGRVVGRDFNEVELGINDCHIFCYCEECMKYMAIDGSLTGPFLHFANIIAKDLGEKYPGLWCTILVYWNVIEPPKQTIPEPNISCGFCFFKQGYCTNHFINGTECAEGKGNTNHSAWFEKWCEIAGKVTAWYYPASWTYNNTLINYLDVMREDYKYMADHDVYGSYLCVGSCDPQYTLAKFIGDDLQWDAYMTDEEYRDLIYEYLCIFYGEDSAPYMMDYLDWVENLETDGCWMGEGSQPNERIWHPMIVADHEYVSSLFDEALRLAESDEAELGIMLHWRAYTFNYLISAHSAKYIDGTDEEKAEYTDLFNEFKKFALETEMEYVTEDMTIEQNPAYVYDYLYEWEPYWWPLPEGFTPPEKDN